jgi:hypothetical protein
MEQQPSNEPLFGLQVDYDSGNLFNEAVKWSKFLAVFYFVCIGLSVLGLAFASTFLIQGFSTYMPGLGLESLGGLIIGVIVLVLLIFTYTTILLYRFSTLVKQGIEQQNQATFNSGLKNLKTYFLIYGVFTLIALVFNVVGFIGDLF